MTSMVFVILIIAVVVFIMVGLTKAVISGIIGYIIGVIVKNLFGGYLISFAATAGIALAPSTIPVVFAIIGVIASFLKD